MFKLAGPANIWLSRNLLQSTGGGRGWGSITGTRQKSGTYQFLLESLFEFQHPLLHLLYGLRQSPAPAKSHSLNALFTVIRVQRTTEQSATALGAPDTCSKTLPCLPRGLCCHTYVLGALPPLSHCSAPGPTKGTVTHPLCGALGPQGCPRPPPRRSALRTASHACLWKERSWKPLWTVHFVLQNSIYVP